MFGHLLANLGLKAFDMIDACAKLDTFGSKVDVFPCILQVLWPSWWCTLRLLDVLLLDVP